MSPNFRAAPIAVVAIALLATVAANPVQLERAQERTISLHLQMESEFDQVRANVSRHMTDVMAGILGVLTPAIDEVSAHRASCPTDTTEFDHHEFLGWELSLCTLEADYKIVAVLDELFAALEAPQNVSVALMSSVLAQVGEGNPVDDLGLVVSNSYRSVQVARSIFRGQTLPALLERVAVVEASIEEMAASTRVCVDQVLAQLADVVCVA